MRGNTRLNAADVENQQFHSFYETKIFNFALKKVPKRLESRAWARSVTFLKRNFRNWSQLRDLAYGGDAISVMYILTQYKQLYQFLLLILVKSTGVNFFVLR